MNLGDKVKDTVTGYEGIVTGRTTFLHGCVRCGITPDHLDKDGKPQDTIWLDQPQLILIKAAAVNEGAHQTGGPMPSVPTRNKDASR